MSSAGRRATGRPRAWAGVVLACGVGLAIQGYAANAAGLFQGGSLLAAAAAVALAGLAAPKGRLAGVLVVNGVACALFLALLWRAPDASPGPGGGQAARAGRDARERMADISRQIVDLESPIMMADPQGINPYVLRPGGRKLQGGSTVRINALGFRGPEIEFAKGDAFRIVVLGESTTFGLTLEPGERPWPEILEARIASELDCHAPVQVINAGVPGWNLMHQVRRLRYDILPLRPDLVISYHGYNGFHLILKEIPSALVERHPMAPPRPSRLLVGAENFLRLAAFNRRYAAARELYESALETDALETDYAALYRRLARILHGRVSALALATFNMAVDERSDPEQIRYYERSVPDVRARIWANRMHSEIVRELGRGPDVQAIDTSEGLDGGGRELFVDLAHFTRAGRERLARNVLRGIRPLLVAGPRPPCRPPPAPPAAGS